MENQKYNQNCISCKTIETCNELLKWKETTGWNLYELNNFFELANINMPIQLEYFDDGKYFTGETVDEYQNYEMYNITIENDTVTSTSKLTIESEEKDTKYVYLIKPKHTAKTYEDAIVLLSYTLKTFHLDKQLETNIQKDSIKKVLTTDDEYLYDISFTLNDPSKSKIISYIADTLRIKKDDRYFDARCVFDSYLLLDIDYYKSAMVIMRTMVMDKLVLSDDDLKALKIVVEVTHMDNLKSKIILDKNVITELTYSNDIYTFTLYNSGRLEISSIDNSLTFSFEDITNTQSDYLTIEKDSFKFSYYLKPFKKLLEDMKDKSWFDLVML